jgi:hypothetical protein
LPCPPPTARASALRAIRKLAPPARLPPVTSRDTTRPLHVENGKTETPKRTLVFYQTPGIGLDAFPRRAASPSSSRSAAGQRSRASQLCRHVRVWLVVVAAGCSVSVPELAPLIASVLAPATSAVSLMGGAVIVASGDAWRARARSLAAVAATLRDVAHDTDSWRLAIVKGTSAPLGDKFNGAVPRPRCRSLARSGHRSHDPRRAAHFESSLLMCGIDQIGL